MIDDKIRIRKKEHISGFLKEVGVFPRIKGFRTSAWAWGSQLIMNINITSGRICLNRNIIWSSFKVKKSIFSDRSVILV